MAGKHRSSNPIFSQEFSCLIGRVSQHARFLNFQSKITDIADVNVVTQLNWKSAAVATPKTVGEGLQKSRHTAQSRHDLAGKIRGFNA